MIVLVVKLVIIETLNPNPPKTPKPLNHCTSSRTKPLNPYTPKPKALNP